ncbi:MAG: Na/Pi cotransporter family protein [Lachnospiraceae bacterium]|nr:Na/Pi cotransporter family protein [Lachnospiraceae bacterium]
MNVFDIISIFGGLALFLYGMRIMGDGLKSTSSGAFQSAIGRVTNNPIMGFLLGLAVTAVIQSSTATIVLTSGLVGAGVITLHQSIGIIIGANVGTTVTGQIIRLLDIDSSSNSWTRIFTPEILAPIACIIGIVCIMALKKLRHSSTIGTIAIGFGILFTGLLNMTAAVEPLSSSKAFSDLFLSLSDNPVLGFLAGTAVAFTLQSSSATVGILQALSVTGQLSFSSIYAILFGIYLGDCVTTAIVCSIGAKANPRRTGIIHLMFNLSGMLLMLIGVVVLRNFTPLLDSIWSAPINSGGIANTNTVFKLAGAVLLLPVCGVFERASLKLIKDDPHTGRVGEIKSIIAGLNRTLYRSPVLALAAAHGTISKMAGLSRAGVEKAFETFDKFDQKTVDLVNEGEGFIDTLADRTSSYLINLSPSIRPDETSRNEQLNYYIKCINEFERIGDHAVNLTENSANLNERGTAFSKTALGEVRVIGEALKEIMGYAQAAFESIDLDAARRIEPLEEVVDDMVVALRENHLKRLRDGRCTIDAGFVFLDFLVNVERISDQCSNIGVYTLAEHDPVIAMKQHDYLRELHQGSDEFFNTQYKECRERYFKKLAEVDKEITLN